MDEKSIKKYIEYHIEAIFNELWKPTEAKLLLKLDNIIEQETNNIKELIKTSHELCVKLINDQRINYDIDIMDIYKDIDKELKAFKAFKKDRKDLIDKVNKITPIEIDKYKQLINDHYYTLQGEFNKFAENKKDYVISSINLKYSEFTSK